MAERLTRFVDQKVRCLNPRPGSNETALQRVICSILLSWLTITESWVDVSPWLNRTEYKLGLNSNIEWGTKNIFDDFHSMLRQDHIIMHQKLKGKIFWIEMHHLVFTIFLISMWKKHFIYKTLPFPAMISLLVSFSMSKPFLFTIG